MTGLPIRMEPGTEIHFSLMWQGKSFGDFIQRPISTPAEEGAIAFLDGFTDKGGRKRVVATYRNGKWGGGKTGLGALGLHEPTIWTVLLPDRKPVGAAEDE